MTTVMSLSKMRQGPLSFTNPLIMEGFPVKLWPEHIAELTDSALAGGWQNFTEDPHQYYVTYSDAYEVHHNDFLELAANGMLALQVDDRFFVAV